VLFTLLLNIVTGKSLFLDFGNIGVFGLDCFCRIGMDDLFMREDGGMALPSKLSLVTVIDD
jgi:hypothetical protein